MDTIIERIKNTNAVIGVIGLGYVGLPIAVEATNNNFNVIGFDVQDEKVALINGGTNYIKDVADDELKKAVDSNKLKATVDFSLLKECDVILICVPTPLDKYFQPDVQYIISAAENILAHRKKPSLIILESTTYPGTTEEVVKPILEKDDSVIGQDLFLAFSPERVDPGNQKYTTKNIPKVVGGCTDKCNEVAAEFYSHVLTGSIHVVSSPKIAEMEKLLENTFRLVNIGLINEMAVLSNKMNIDIWEVIEAAKTKPYGFMPFYPGPGLGGHCIPIDPYYLTWKAKEFHFQTTLIEAAGQTNRQMPEYVVERVGIILNSNKKYYADASIVILGVAYKKNIDDYRESPALRIHLLLQQLNAKVKLVDPHVKEFKGLDGTVYTTEEMSDEILQSADLVVVITDHDKFDEDRIVTHANLIYDTRNMMKTKSDKIYRL